MLTRTRSVTLFRKNLREMEVGASLKYPRKDHNGYMATKSLLKSRGEGTWYAECGKYDREGTLTRIS